MYLLYNTPLPSFAALERLFSMNSAIHQAKRASLTSRNFQQFDFLKKNFDGLKWQGVAQDEFDDMFSMYSNNK